MKTNLVSLRILICLLTICAICDISCRRKAPPKAPSPEPETTTAETDVKPVEPTTVAETDPNSIAVAVNGVEITEGEIDEFLAPHLSAMTRQAHRRPPGWIERRKQMYRPRALDQLIANVLIAEKAEQANIAVTEEEVVSQLMEIASTQRPPMSFEQLKESVE